ncbi:enoyl-CoA hydratase/isomerase family protein [Halobacteriales archaeon Cl-PHB]
MSDDALEVDPDLLRVEPHDHADGVLTIVLDRPEKKNALSYELQDELVDVLEAARERDDLRVVVLIGTDEAGAFASGADIADFEDTGTFEKRRSHQKHRFLNVIDEYPKPIIAAIDGYAFGGGCELAQACDIRVATTEAKLGQLEVNIGIIPGGGATQRLPRLVGEGQAMRLILSGEIIDGEEARDIGLVDILCEPDELADTAHDLASNIADKSPVAVEAGKRAVRQASRMPLDAGLEYESEAFALTFSSEDKEEGVAAFLEEREPEWKGK